MCPGPGVCWRDFAHALSKYIFIPPFFFTTSADFALVIRYLWSNFPLTRLTLSHMNTGWFLLTGHLHISVTHTVLRSPVHGNKQKQLKQTHVTTTHNVLQAHAWRFWALWRVNVAAGWLAGRREEELVHERSHESEDLLKSRLQQQGARVITVFHLHPFSFDNVRSWRSQKKRDGGIINPSMHCSVFTLADIRVQWGLQGRTQQNRSEDEHVSSGHNLCTAWATRRTEQKQLINTERTRKYQLTTDSGWTISRWPW